MLKIFSMSSLIKTFKCITSRGLARSMDQLKNYRAVSKKNTQLFFLNNFFKKYVKNIVKL